MSLSLHLRLISNLCLQFFSTPACPPSCASTRKQTRKSIPPLPVLKTLQATVAWSFTLTVACMLLTKVTLGIREEYQVGT